MTATASWFTKHGAHDQKTHGHRGGGSTGTLPGGSKGVYDELFHSPTGPNPPSAREARERLAERREYDEWAKHPPSNWSPKAIWNLVRSMDRPMLRALLSIAASHLSPRHSPGTDIFETAFEPAFAKALVEASIALGIDHEPVFKEFTLLWDAHQYAAFAKHSPSNTVAPHDQKTHGRRGGMAGGRRHDESAAAPASTRTSRATELAAKPPRDTDVQGAGVEGVQAHGGDFSKNDVATADELLDPEQARKMALDRTFPGADDPRNGDPELAGKVAEVLKINDTYLTNGQDTETLHSEKIAGYSPARRRMHVAALTGLMASAEREAAKQGGSLYDAEALMMGGLPGSGKSTLLRNEAAKLTEGRAYLTINADTFKGMLATGRLPDGTPIPHWEETGVPGWEGLKFAGKEGDIGEGGGAAPLLHEESSHLSHMLGSLASREGMNIVFDFTMPSEATVNKRLDELTDPLGPKYKSTGVFVDVPTSRSQSQALKRFRGKDNAYDGRIILVDTAHRQSQPKRNTGRMSSNREVFDGVRTRFDTSHLVTPRDRNGKIEYDFESEFAVRRAAPDSEPISDTGKPTESDTDTNPAGPVEGYTGILTLHFSEYAAGRLSYDDLRAFLVSFPFKPLTRVTARPEDYFQASIWADEQGGAPEIDTIEELERAWTKGLVSDEEYLDLHEAVADRAADEREPETPPAIAAVPLPEDVVAPTKPGEPVEPDPSDRGPASKFPWDAPPK